MSNETLIIIMLFLSVAQVLVLLFNKRPERPFDAADAIGLLYLIPFVWLTINIL
jgi:hypothetical protein